jgi:hypothetical protein
MDAFHPAAGKRHGYFPLPARDDREVTAEVVTTNYFRRSLFMKPALLVIDVQKEFFKADAQTIQSLNTAIEGLKICQYFLSSISTKKIN